MDTKAQEPNPKDVDALVDMLLDAIDKIKAERDAALAEVEQEKAWSKRQQHEAETVEHELRTALAQCVDAIDRMMGDTDLVEDDSLEFRAIQQASLLLNPDTPEVDHE